MTVARSRSRLRVLGLLVLSAAFGHALAASAEEPRALGDNAESVAVIIGNKTYRKTVSVDFADNDAKAMQEYLVKGLGFREANVITLPDATRNDLEYELGSDASPEGDLFNRVRPDRSNVFVYYSGHGVPDVTTGRSFLLPSDGYPNSSGSGYALETLYRNLEIVKRKVGSNRQVIVMIDACFTGETGRKDQKLLEVSAPGFVPVRPKTGAGIIKLVASSSATPANWDRANRLGLFTSRFLLGVGGLAAPGASGALPWSQLRQYVMREVEQTARVEDRREQKPEIDEAALTLPPSRPVTTVTKAIALSHDEAGWREAQAKGTRQAYEAYIGNCDPDACPHKAEALARLNDDMSKTARDVDRQNWERFGKDQKYQAYLETCTAGQTCAYRDIAEQYLKLTKAKEAPQAPVSQGDPDETDFKVAAAVNTVEAYRDYLSRHASGRHLDDAIRAIRKIAELGEKERDQSLWMEALNKDGAAGTEAMRYYLDRFPTGMHADEAKKRVDDSTPQLAPQTPVARKEVPEKTNVPLAPAAKSLWKHNGSVLSLVSNGDRRKFVYERPRAGLPASRGETLFEGKRTGNTYAGTAHLFSPTCGSVDYRVSGSVSADQTHIRLVGKAPVRASNCVTIAHRNDLLLFDYIQ